MASVVAPFVRVLRGGEQGQDVVAVQRALRRARFRWIPPTGKHGSVSRRNVRRLQAKAGLPQTGTYSLATHRALRSLGAFDAYGGLLMRRERNRRVSLDLDDRRRRAIASVALHVVPHRDEIHYTQGSLRFVGVTARIKPPDFPRFADCSSFATWCYWAASAEEAHDRAGLIPDPNGRGYDGFGYTGTLIGRGTVVSINRLRPGDLVFYGSASARPGFPAGSPTHVAVYVGSGKVVSHGNEAGPQVLPVLYRTVNHARTYPVAI